MLYYSPLTKGFYSDEMHGARTLEVPDPRWVRPEIEVPDPNWVRPDKMILDPDWVRPMKEIEDPRWQRPKISIPDPTWIRPQYSFLGVPDGNGRTPVIFEPDMSVEHPMIEVPDMSIPHPMIEVPDEDAKPGTKWVPDSDAKPSTQWLEDAHAKHPTITVPNDACKLPIDVVPITEAEHAALLNEQTAGKNIEPGPDGRPVAVARPVASPEELKQRLSAAVQAMLDQQAQSLGYDTIASAVTYAEEPAVPKYQKEGKALRAWRSKVWEATGKALPGKSPLPTKEQLLLSLPSFTLE